MKTLYQYIIALLIATMSACTPVPAFAGDTHNVTVYGKPVTIVVSNSSKQMTAKILTNLKREMETILADADSAKYLVDEGGNLVLHVFENGESKIILNYGFRVNAKNKMGAYVGYKRLCVFTTKTGQVANIGFAEEGDELMPVCMTYMHAVAEDI